MSIYVYLVPQHWKKTYNFFVCLFHLTRLRIEIVIESFSDEMDQCLARVLGNLITDIIFDAYCV